MPKLGPSVEQATVIRWHKAEGDKVRQGELILDIETEKTVHEVEAEADGILHKTLVQEGQSCQVGTVLALLGVAGERVAGAPVAVAQAPAPDPQRPVAAAAGVPARMGASAAAAGDEREIDRVLIKSSPAARRVARERSVDLSMVTGTGPHGRIVSDDVVRAAKAAQGSSGPMRVPTTPADGPPSMAREPAPPAAIAGITVKERRPLTSVRRTIAERMVRSKQSAPHFHISMDVDMTRVKETRQAWRQAGETSVPSYNDFILWATAQALRSFPELNASLAGDDLVIYSDINVGMATSAPDGLVVPVIQRADRLSVRGLASRSGDLAARARDRKLLPASCEGATFSVSNLGMFGVASFSAIINPPQSAILAVGQVAPRVVTDGSSISIRTFTTLTLSVDHRVADGVLASHFLGALKQLLETFREGE